VLSYLALVALAAVAAELSSLQGFGVSCLETGISLVAGHWLTA
jgi:hypothetical protein